ncbi:MAG: hypothetical protein QOG15_1513 [Solirubrobacteraceae bacterium]|jgi:hypothetical protein|nr:hypothetical protein [Solirubrobacteraceae bacterium]
MAHSQPPEPGEVRHQRLQGSDATYRVVSTEGEHVMVEVIEAPGLEAGYRIRMLREAVQAMNIIEP